MVLFELDRLKSSINEALRVSLRPAPGFHHSLASDSRVARNLRNLAEAARHFHSAASSTASTVRDGSMAPQRARVGGTSSSLFGDFPAYRQERVEMFIRDAQGHAAGQITPARAASPPPDWVRSPGSTSIATPQPLRLAISVPAETVTEDDECDEAEFEKLFLDGLEDLAKDSIRRKDFGKAIELLKEAIRRQEKTNSEEEDLRRLQTQLALCHFFKDDWKQAEPIVSALARSAKSNSQLDPVVWTMLHALALAHLSTYAFDSALQMCKKALQGKKKWAKANGSNQRALNGFAETTGLLATIFQMKGDYIAAEIYRRQQPADFVYQHSSNPREFLSRQRDLLEEVLGDDLPDFCDLFPVTGLPEFHELYGSTQLPVPASIQRLPAMRRSHTVNGGDTSPLRTVRHQWEKFESDTSKEVVFIEPDLVEETDADDEASTNASNSPSNVTVGGWVRRRTTRILATRRGRYPRSEKEDTGVDSEASLTASPISRWFKGGNIFAVKPSRTVLRKRLDRDVPAARLFGWKRRKTFRVLHVTKPDSGTSSSCRPSEEISMVSIDNRSRAELADNARASPPASKSSTDRDTDNFVVRNGVLYADTFRHNSSENWKIPQISELSGQHMTSHMAELSASSFSDADKRDLDRDYITKTLCEYSLFPLARAGYSYDRAGISYLALPTLDDYSEITALEARVAVGEDCGSNSLWIGTVTGEASQVGMVAGASDETDAAPREASEIDVIPDRKHDLSLHEPAKGPMVLQHKPIIASLSPEGTATLSQLAGILASLSARKDFDANKLHATKLDLEALSSSLEKFSTDAVLRYDIRRVIKSLDRSGVESVRSDETQDSGYESMGQASGEDSAQSDGEGPGSKHVPRKLKPPATRDEDGKKPRTPVLKRQFSFMSGDEATYWSSPTSHQDMIPHVKHPIATSARKQVQWALSKNRPKDAAQTDEDGREMDGRGSDVHDAQRRMRSKRVAEGDTRRSQI